MQSRPRGVPAHAGTVAPGRTQRLLRRVRSVLAVRSFATARLTHSAEPDYGGRSCASPRGATQCGPGRSETGEARLHGLGAGRVLCALLCGSRRDSASCPSLYVITERSGRLQSVASGEGTAPSRRDRLTLVRCRSVWCFWAESGHLWGGQPCTAPSPRSTRGLCSVGGRAGAGKG